MKSRQYTIRNIPDRLDQKLRQKAKQADKSLNQVVLEALAKDAGLSARPVKHHDLDWFIGTGGNLGPEFDAAMEDFEQIDDESWNL